VTLLRSPVHRGVVAIDALRFERDGSRRVLGAWRSGSSLYRLEDDTLLLRFSSPVSVRCESAPGQPLVRCGGALCSAPVPDAWAPLTGIGPVVVVEGGVFTGLGIAEQLDPTALLDLSDWVVVHPPVPVVGGPAQVPPPIEDAVAPPADFDPRTRLTATAQPEDRTVKRWRRLSASPEHQPARRPSGGAGGQQTGSSRPRLLERAILNTPLWALLRRRHERYLARLSGLFERPDLDRALREAIPLGEGGARLALRPPSPRSDLRISPEREANGSVIPVDATMRGRLQGLYRQAYTRLDAEGRVREAAFVLCELLNQIDEACAYLERHGEIRLAAELAEARSTEPALVVRLWWQAGERHRAVALARRYGCFDAAVVRLERAGRDAEAADLRLEWREVLLSGGDLVGAYDVVAGLERPGLDEWRREVIDLGVQHGRPLRARMLARHLQLGSAEPHRALRPVLDEPSLYDERLVLAADLASAVKDKVTSPHPSEVRTLVRRLLVDRAAIDGELLGRLVTHSGDRLLQADLPPLSQRPRTPAAPAPEPLWIEADSTDRGLLGAHDACLLPDGRVAVALGELGTRIVGLDGRLVHHWDIPSTFLVPSDTGTRLLAGRIFPGGISVQVIDLLDRRHRHLGALTDIRHWACSYDGLQWLFADDTGVVVLDALAGEPTSIGRPDVMSGSVIALARTSSDLAFAVTVEEEIVEVHTYSLPELRQKRRHRQRLSEPAALSPTGELREGATAVTDGHVLHAEASENGWSASILDARTGGVLAQLRLANSTRVAARLDRHHAVIADELGRVEVVDLGSGTRSAALRLRP
jgi:hypothetical protein